MSRDLTGRRDVGCCCYEGAEMKKWNVKKMQIGWVMARFISTSHITKQIVTDVIGDYWKLFPLSCKYFPRPLASGNISNCGEIIFNSHFNVSNYLYMVDRKPIFKYQICSFWHIVEDNR